MGKTVYKQIFQTLRKLQRRELLKKCKYRNFSSHKQNIYSLPLFLLNPNSKISRQFFKETNQPLDCEFTAKTIVLKKGLSHNSSKDLLFPKDNLASIIRNVYLYIHLK